MVARGRLLSSNLRQSSLALTRAFLTEYPDATAEDTEYVDSVARQLVHAGEP